MNIEDAIEAMISSGELNREDLERRIKDQTEKSTTKKDLDNLGVSQVGIMKQLKDLADRVTKLEGGSV